LHDLRGNQPSYQLTVLREHGVEAPVEVTAFIQDVVCAAGAVLPVFDEGVEELAEWLEGDLLGQRVLGPEVSEQGGLGDSGALGDLLRADVYGPPRREQRVRRLQQQPSALTLDRGRASGLAPGHRTNLTPTTSLRTVIPPAGGPLLGLDRDSTICPPHFYSPTCLHI
jgi:hypothetical protein